MKVNGSSQYLHKFNESDYLKCRFNSCPVKVYDLTRMLNVQPGKLLKSAFTIARTPKLAKAPRMIPQGTLSIFAAACFEAISSEEYFSSQRNRKSVRTNTPLWLVCNLSIYGMHPMR